jgi:hypothetical protein
MASQLYQPARLPPICTIQGHTCSGGASIVMACVALKIAFGTSERVLRSMTPHTIVSQAHSSGRTIRGVRSPGARNQIQRS